MVIAGQSPDGSSFNARGDGLPFYQGKKDFTERYIGAPTVWTTEITKEAVAGDILMSVRAPVGPINYATQRACIGRGLAAIRPTAIDPDFLFYNLLSKQSEIAGREGAVFASINRDEIKRIRVPLPPLAEQQRIVAILDDAFEGISAAEQAADKNLINGTDLFRGTREALFSNRDASWIIQPFGTVCENLDGQRRPVTKGDRVPGNVPYYGASGIVDYVQGQLFDEDLLLVSEDGANLLTRTYPIAFSISGPSWVNNHAHVLRFADERTRTYVEHYLNSIDLRPYVSGMAQPKLNQGALNGILIPMPPVTRQAEIAVALEQMQLETENFMKTMERKRTLLAELKQSLLASAFSGELTREPLAA